MIYLQDVIDAYLNARRNKRRSNDQAEFEMHWEANCYKLYLDIVNRCVQPAAYTFVVNYPKPREIFASDMSTRILHHYLDARLRPIVEKKLSPNTFNNRIGMGQQACQNALISDIYEMTKGFTKQDCWLVKIDIKGCFPNINKDIAYKQLSELIESEYHERDKDELHYILRTCIYSYSAEHCERRTPITAWETIPKEKSLFNKPPNVGAEIGHLIWQLAVNYYFNDVEKWLISLGIKYKRFVDDFVFVTNNKESFLALLPELRQRFALLGAKINENKFYCQHYTKGIEWLGSHIKMDRIYPNERAIKKAKYKASVYNRNINPYKIEKVLASLNSYLGICKNQRGFTKANEIVRKLNYEWFRYIKFNRRRVCLQAKPKYSQRNLLIRKYNLI